MTSLRAYLISRTPPLLPITVGHFLAYPHPPPQKWRHLWTVPYLVNIKISCLGHPSSQAHCGHVYQPKPTKLVSNDSWLQEEQILLIPLYSEIISGCPNFEFCPKMENRRSLFNDFSTKIQIAISQKELIETFWNLAHIMSIYRASLG